MCITPYSMYYAIYQYLSICPMVDDNHQLIQVATNRIISICNLAILNNYIFIETSNKFETMRVCTKEN